MPLDPVDLTQSLVRCPSVTPADAGAIPLLQSLLSEAGFQCARADRGGISNLVARWGPKAHPKTFGFNGHTDVVPAGDPAEWSADPFAAEIVDGWLIGRGATDMKSGVAAFVAAAVDFVQGEPPDGSIIITVTGDEEGVATDGTTAILDYLSEQGEQMSVCLVGEPTCPSELGDMIKIGRRGSMTAFFVVTGIQGHSAYPHRARNPVPILARLVDRLSQHDLDTGTEHFDPSTLAVTTIDTGNTANNVIPSTCKATVNIRFNDAHTSDSLTEWLQREAEIVSQDTGVTIAMTTQVSGQSFLTPPGELSAMVSAAVQQETGRTPSLSTSGGTSDARFIKAHCPVVEFGLVGQTMHQVDERVEVSQVVKLKEIYLRILREYFG